MSRSTYPILLSTLNGHIHLCSHLVFSVRERPILCWIWVTGKNILLGVPCGQGLVFLVQGAEHTQRLAYIECYKRLVNE